MIDAFYVLAALLLLAATVSFELQRRREKARASEQYERLQRVIMMLAEAGVYVKSLDLDNAEVELVRVERTTVQ